MSDLSPSEHKTLLMNLAGLWQQARTDGTALIGEAETKAKALEQDAATAFANAAHAAEQAFLLVKHDIETGVVKIFHLQEVDTK